MPSPDVTSTTSQVTSGDGTYSATLYLDPKTKLLVQLAYSDGAVQTLEQYGDYKDVGGIKIAHQRDASGGGESSSLKVLEVELDPAVEASAFARPKP